MPTLKRPNLAQLMPKVDVVQQWRGPKHMKDQLSRMTAFLDQHPPK